MYEYTLYSDLVFSNPILLTLTGFDNYSLSLPMIADAWQTGVWKGLFLGLPLSVAHILIWRTAFFDNWKLAFCGIVGKSVGELLLIFSIILGWRNLFQLWYVASPFLMFFSVSYIVFVTTFDNNSQKLSVPFSPSFNSKTRLQYTMGFLSHLFLAITQQTYVCHRLSNIAIDWDDKIPFGSFFKTSQGYIDQIIPGTTFSFCLGLVAGYVLITVIWFYFGTFTLTTFFSILYKLAQSPKYFVEQYENNSGGYVNRDYPWFVQIYYMRLKPALRKAKLNVAFLIKVLIYGLTWAHVFHCSPSYISAEGFQLVSHYCDSKIINSAYEQKISNKIDPSIRPIVTKIAKTRRKDLVTSLQNLPELKEYEKQVSKKGAFVFGDRIYSQQLLTRFGPYAPIGKYGDKWGWGDHVIGQKRPSKHKPSPNVEVASLLEKKELFQKIRFYVTETGRNINSFLDMIATRLEEEYVLKVERDKKGSPPSSDEDLKSGKGYVDLQMRNEELFVQDQRSRGYEVVEQAAKKTESVDYYAFINRQQAKSKQMKKSPGFRPSLNFSNLDPKDIAGKVKKEKTKEDLEKEKLEKEDLEDIKKARTSREIEFEEKEKFDEKFKDPQFEAIQDRSNMWGLRKVIRKFKGTNDSMVELFDDDDEEDDYISEYIKFNVELKKKRELSKKKLELSKKNPSVLKEELKKEESNKKESKKKESKKKAKETKSDKGAETESEVKSGPEEFTYEEEVIEDYTADEGTDLEDDDFEDELVGKDGEKKEETPEQKKKRFKRTDTYLLNRLAKQNLQLLTTFPLRTQVSYFPSQQLYPEIKRIQKNNINENKQFFNEFNFDKLKRADRPTRKIVLDNRKLKRKQKSLITRLMRNKPRRRGVKKSTLLDVASRKPLFAIALLDKTTSIGSTDSFMFNEYKSFKPLQRVSGNFIKDGFDKIESNVPEDEPIRSRRLNVIDNQDAQIDVYMDSETIKFDKIIEDQTTSQRKGDQTELQKEKIFKDSIAIPSFSMVSSEYPYSVFAKLQKFSQQLALRASERKLDLITYFRRKRTMHSISELEFLRDKRKIVSLKSSTPADAIIPSYIAKYKPLTQKEIVKRINESPTFKTRAAILNRSSNAKRSLDFFNFNIVKPYKESASSPFLSSVIDRKLNKKSLLKLENTQIVSDWDFWRTQSFSKIWEGMRQNFVSKKQKNSKDLYKYSEPEYKEVVKDPEIVVPRIKEARRGLFFETSPSSSKKPAFFLPPRDKDSKTFEPALNPSEPSDFVFVRKPGGKLFVKTRKDVSLDYNRDIRDDDKTTIKIGNVPILNISSHTSDSSIQEIVNGRVQPSKKRYEYEILSINPRKQIKKATDQILKHTIVPPLKLISNNAGKISRFAFNQLYFPPQSVIPILYTPNPKKKKRIYFYNAALFFSDCYYIGKFLQLPGIKKTDENLNERRSSFLMYWMSRTSDAAVQPVLFKLFKKKKDKGAKVALPEKGFFVRSLEKPSDFEDYKKVTPQNSSYLNTTNFDTERRYYKYHKSPLYRALLSYNVSCMLNHELPSTVLHNSLNKKETESIRQKMFIYYQTRHLNNLNKSDSIFQDNSSPIFSGITSFEDDQNPPKFIDPKPFTYPMIENESSELNDDSFESLDEVVDEKSDVVENKNNSNIKDNETRTIDEMKNLDGVIGFFQQKSKSSLLNTSTLNPRASFPLKEESGFVIDIDQEIIEDSNDSGSELLTVDEVKMIDQLTDSYVFNPKSVNSKISKSSKILTPKNETNDEESDSLDILSSFFSKLFGEETINIGSLSEDGSTDDNSVEVDQNLIDPTLTLDNRIQIPMPSFIRDKFEQRSKLLNYKNQIENQEWSSDLSSSILKSQVLSQLSKRENYFTKSKRNNKLKLPPEISNVPLIVPTIKNLGGKNRLTRLISTHDYSPSSYPITFKIIMPKKLKKQSKVRFIFDTLPLRTNVSNFTDKKIGFIQNVSGAPLRTFSTMDNVKGYNKFSAFNSINTIWKPSIFAGPNLRELPIQAISLKGGILPIHNRVSSRAVSSKNIWNLNGVTFSGEKNLYRTPGPYRLGPFSFEPILGSQLLYDFTNGSDKTLLPFLEDFWSAKLRLETYDSWLNVLPSTSTDPLYLKARDTVIRLRHSQKIRIQRLAFEQKWYLKELVERILNTSLDLKQRAKLSTLKILRMKQNLEFLESYLNSFGLLSVEDDLKISSQNFEMEVNSSLTSPEALVTFLRTDKRYKPWYHEEIQMPECTNLPLYDPYASLTNILLLRQDDLFPNIFLEQVSITDLDDAKISIDQEYIFQAKTRRNRK